MFGIYAYGLLDQERADKVIPEVSRWNSACRRGAGELDTRHKSENEAFSKREFIALYISEHSKGRPEKPGLVAPPDTGRHSVSWRSPDPEAFLSGIEAELLDGKVYADSYIAQRLKLPRAPGATRDTIIIGLDTNQAGLLVDVWDTLMGHSPISANIKNHPFGQPGRSASEVARARRVRCDSRFSTHQIEKSAD
jgi:hypothetical protein